jgi:hypothetical protein
MGRGAEYLMENQHELEEERVWCERQALFHATQHIPLLWNMHPYN